MPKIGPEVRTARRNQFIRAARDLASETGFRTLTIDDVCVTVVRVEGDIVRGDNARDPFGAVTAVGSSPVVRAIRRAADDPRVAAIVVRIDSPGGDGTASDLIWRELYRARVNQLVRSDF